MGKTDVRNRIMGKIALRNLIIIVGGVLLISSGLLLTDGTSYSNAKAEDFHCLTVDSNGFAQERFPGCGADQESVDNSVIQEIEQAPSFLIAGLGSGIVGIAMLLAGILAYIQTRKSAWNLSTSNATMSAGPITGIPVSVGSIGASQNSRPSNIESELQKLSDMKERGVIDETEYKRLRENLISRS